MENEEHLSIEEIFFRATAIFGFQPKIKSFNWMRLFDRNIFVANVNFHGSMNGEYILME